MTSAISQAVTNLNRCLPTSVQAVLLREAEAIADQATKFHNGHVWMYVSLAIFRNAEFNPGGVIDIDVNIGLWTGQVSQIFTDAKFLIVEA